MQTAALTIAANRFHYHKDTRSFSEEMSSLGLRVVPRHIYLVGSHHTVTFTATKTDMVDAEDIAGWRYEGQHPTTRERFELLIIND